MDSLVISTPKHVLALAEHCICNSNYKVQRNILKKGCKYIQKSGKPKTKIANIGKTCRR